VWQQKFIGRLLKIPVLPTNDDPLPTNDDRKTSIYRQAIELPMVSAKVGSVTPLYAPYFGTPLSKVDINL